MQLMSSSISSSPNFNNNFSATGFSDAAGKFSHDFGFKLHLKADEEPIKEQEQEQEQEDKLINQPEIKDDEEEEEQNEEKLESEEEEDEEFSFVCLNPDGSPISADDLFQDGQIRPVFPLFNQDLLFSDENGSEDGDVTLRPPVRRFFVEDSSDAASSSSSSDPAGPYCEWRGGKTVTEVLPDTCRKSNSTGFSKLWRFRDLKLRCSSDGKDAFVFLNHPPPSTSSSSEKTEKKIEKTEKAEKKSKAKVSGEKTKAKSGKTASLSAHAKLYVKNRAQREGDKRRSYLPYKQFGFFTSMNGLSRNVHPF